MSIEKLGYRLVGKNKHSAVKVCEWCKKSLRSNNFCYKQKFYGIESHRCVQMSPVIFNCTQNCKFCWRTLDYVLPKKQEWDEPSEIIDECIERQKEMLQGFCGNAEGIKFYNAMRPNQFAISLSGEPCLYPFLPEMIDELKKRKITSFLVTNGTVPEMVEKLISTQPTQFYVTLAAPDNETYIETCQPIIKDGWQRLMKTLDMIKEFKRSVIRLTLVRNLNMKRAEKYAELIDKANPKFVEVKSFMSVGGSRKRLPYDSMPLHNEIISFAKIIEKHSSYKIKDEKRDSRVVLMVKK